MPFKKKIVGKCRFCRKRIGKSYYMIGVKKTILNKICPNCIGLFIPMKNTFMSEQQEVLRNIYTYIYDNIEEVMESRINKVVENA